MLELRDAKQPPTTNINRPVPGERLKMKVEAMDEKVHKMKSVQKEINDMYEALEKNMNIDVITKQENKLKTQQKLINKQEIILKVNFQKSLFYNLNFY